MIGNIKNDLGLKLRSIEERGFFKHEIPIFSSQGSHITISEDREVLNFCSNNYLGLSNHPAVIKAAQETMEVWGYGLSSVRFICGTQKLHIELENAICCFLGTEDTLLYTSCFDANAGLFEPLLDEQDAIISDEFNHASIIDGVRLCKAKRYCYKHSDMRELENCLNKAQKERYRLICTDGIFSMDGDIARLKEICELAEKYDALVIVDDSHATGYIGETGRGTPEVCGVQGKVDLITTTFGKALGGASGGCTSGRKELIMFLRQRSRPYLFSNSLAPAIVGATLKILEMLEGSGGLRKKLMENSFYFRKEMQNLGFDVPNGETAIIPVMLYEERIASEIAKTLLNEGIYVVAFSYPVVPRGKARIRVQISAVHKHEDLIKTIDAFERAGKKLSVI